MSRAFSSTATSILRRQTFRQSSMSQRGSLIPSVPPSTCTTISIGPISLMDSTSLPGTPSAKRSAARTTCPSPAPPIDSRTSLRPLSVRAVRATTAPSAASACATALPMPRLAPVMSAFLPLILKSTKQLVPGGVHSAAEIQRRLDAFALAQSPVVQHAQ